MPSYNQGRYSFDPETGKPTAIMPEPNDFMLNYNQAYSVFKGNTGVTPPEEINSLIARLEELESLYKREDITDERDSMYGRKRHQVTHVPTGTVVDSGVNKRGSLGS